MQSLSIFMGYKKKFKIYEFFWLPFGYLCVIWNFQIIGFGEWWIWKDEWWGPDFRGGDYPALEFLFYVSTAAAGFIGNHLYEGDDHEKMPLRCAICLHPADFPLGKAPAFTPDRTITLVFSSTITAKLNPAADSPISLAVWPGGPLSSTN